MPSLRGSWVRKLTALLLPISVSLLFVGLGEACWAPPSPLPLARTPSPRRSDGGGRNGVGAPRPRRPYFSLLHRRGRSSRRPPRRAEGLRLHVFTQVISDVDDTLKSSGGVNVGGVALGGIDVQYGRGEVYPGVAEFILQISLQRQHQDGGDDLNLQLKKEKQPRLKDDAVVSSGDGSPQSPQRGSRRHLTPPCVAILTARAKEFKAALKLKDDSPIAVKFRAAGERAGVPGWGLGPVLYGSVAEWIVQDRKGLRKFTNFELLIRQDPTGTIMQYVYLGDTGELDQEAGETMLREYPEVVKAVFLHYVTDVQGPVASVPPPKWINGRPIVFFRTYVGAAVAAVQLGYMSLSGLEYVAQAAAEQLSGVPQTSDKWIDLNRDLDRAYRLTNPSS